ncbi:unnamed protein product [Ostreobium quekettii]|uniref:Myeloid leukemia factor n=1 Tax=Ostreobium quekettii TaxID=121088 RepID=A0A8S1IRU1_9CHLO|nr:unnamed protein product [Ostreobium quekettii]
MSAFRGNVFRDFFGEDPFEQMDSMMESMFRDPFFAGSHRRHPGYHDRQVDRRGDGRQRARGPVIEEVEDEGVGAGEYQEEPIIEEPGEDEQYWNNQDHQQRRHSGRHRERRQPRGDNSAVSSGFRMEMGPNMIPSLTTFGNGPSTTCFSYSNTYSSGFGPTQVYSSTTTSRMGPGGVRETQTTVRDGMAGQEEISISRGIGERERIITRRRDAAGREETIDTLQHMTPEEAAGFDQEWMQQAGRNLPSFGGSGTGMGRMLEQPRSQSGGRPQIGYRGYRNRYA